MNRKDFIKTGVLATAGLVSTTSMGNMKKGGQMENKLKIKDVKKANICKTCGTRYAAEKFNEDKCPICLDDRQYLREYGQEWVSYEGLTQKHMVKISPLEDDIFELTTVPSFAIGQRALLIATSEGNILWDCIPLLDEATYAFIKSRGGLKAIAISHPHYYSLMAEWARAFDCKIYLHEKDKVWVMDDDTDVKYWGGEKHKLVPGLEIIHTGGHFPGSSVLHFKPSHKEGRLLVGDSLYLSRDKKHISAMFSYPNVIPLASDELNNVFEGISRLEFDALYGAFGWQNIHSGAKKIFENSFKRYHRIYDRQ